LDLLTPKKTGENEVVLSRGKVATLLGKNPEGEGKVGWPSFFGRWAKAVRSKKGLNDNTVAVRRASEKQKKRKDKNRG